MSRTSRGVTPNNTTAVASESTLPPSHYSTAAKDDDDKSSMGEEKESGAEELEEIIHEDLEPLEHNPLIDAASLPDQSLVTIRCFPDKTKLQTICVQRADKGTTSLTLGWGLGLPSELFKLVVLESHLATTVRETSTAVVCYGDRIALQSMSEQRFIGVRPCNSDNAAETNPAAFFSVGCFRSIASQTEQWMVLRAKGVVRVGRSAVDHYATTPARGPTAPVQAGDAIVLRNCQTGGILASADDDGWTVLMDSYDSNRVRHGVAADPTLLGRLQRHDRLLPMAMETLYFAPAASPPMPMWANNRIFLTGSYLLYPNRHDNESARQLETWTDATSEHPHVDLSQHARTELQQPLLQERFLVDELLGSFLGLEGQLIRVRPTRKMSEISFYLVEQSDELSLDKIMCRMVQQMLPLSTAYARVRHFVGSHLAAYEYGRVMHRFCETMDGLLREYASFVGSLETAYRQHGDHLTLSVLQVQIQPSLHILVVLGRAVEAVRCHTGGALLNSLRNLKLRTYQGNELACSILQRLLEAAAVPYLKMLDKWLERGVLVDPHGEFMIQCSEEGSWETRYEIASDHVLDGFFSTSLTVERVLATGRYWNAVHKTCSKRGTLTDTGDEGKSEPTTECNLQYSESTAVVASCVQTNYQKASQALVGLLSDEFDLVGSLRIVKRYFLLDHGDFFLHFLDAAEMELRKNLSNISRGRLQHWLDTSIQLTEHHLEESYQFPTRASRKQRNEQQKLSPTGIRCRFAPESLADHLDKLHAASGGIDTKEPWTPLRHTYGGLARGGELTGLDAFMVDFTSIPFPVSLILSQRALACYQLLFRHLFCAKHVERRLVGIWRDHQGMKELQSLRGSLGPTFLLRQRMLHFLQNLIYYMMLEVVEPQWSEMEAAITSCCIERTERTIDDILQVHMQFLQKALEACLLTNRDLVRALTKLLKTCLLFSDQMSLFMKATKIEDDRHNVAAEKQKVVQKNLNKRRDSKRYSMDRKALHKSMQSSQLERKQRIQRQTARVEREIMGESYPRMISRFDEVFSDNLREFMAQLTHSDDLYRAEKINLCNRLDYNGYVTRAMGLRTTSR